MSGQSKGYTITFLWKKKVYRTYKELGLKPKDIRNVTFKKTDKGKMAVFQEGYLLLCAKDGCFNVTYKNEDICRAHFDGKELHSHCRYPDICFKYSTHGLEQGKPLYCSTHKENGMEDVKHIRCQKCRKRGRFGYLGESDRFCAIHKEDDMQDLDGYHRKCETCGIFASFGFKGGYARFCAKHQEDGMENVSVKNKRCEKCRTIANFGFRGGPAIFCSKHQEDGMENVVSKKCEKCEKYPNFGYPGQEARFCFTHQELGMVDVKHIKCGEGCSTRPSYSELFSGKNSHCRAHANLNDYSIRKKYPKCTTLSCGQNAYFYPSENDNIYPVRCRDHQLPDDIELVKRICPECSDELYYPIDRDNCMECGRYRVKTLLRFKELMRKAFLESNGYTFIYDKRISLNGSRFKPDFNFQGTGGVELLFEEDENQHVKYDGDREITRMVTIYHDIQLIKKGKSVLFIRCNPDDYEGKQLTQEEKMIKINDVLQKYINVESIGTELGVIYLFYDGYDGSDKIISIDLNRDVDLSGEEEEKDEEGEEEEGGEGK